MAGGPRKCQQGVNETWHAVFHDACLGCLGGVFSVFLILLILDQHAVWITRY